MSFISGYNYEVQKLNLTNFLSDQDSAILDVVNINSTFNINTDRITLDIFSLDSTLLFTDTNLRTFNVERQGSTDPSSIDTISIDPQQDAIRYGYDRGDVVLSYNFVRDLSTNDQSTLSYIIESISPDRTEVRAYTVSDSTILINNLVRTVQDRIQNGLYYEELRAYFNSTFNPIVTNIDKQVVNDRTYLLVKFYEPLPINIKTKDSFSVIELVGETQAYAVSALPQFSDPVYPSLGGPNFSVQLPVVYNIPSEYKSLNDILLDVTGSNYKAYSVTGQPGAFISIDHSEYENFVHFSSAQERLANFRFKLEKIQALEASKSLAETNTGSILSNTITDYDNQIVDILKNFDHYDRFLFYESGSKNWPKVSNDYPYLNADVYDQVSIDFYYSQSVDASYYDSTNVHRLLNAVPIYIKDDPANAPYNLFIDMIGQHFDILWLYAKALSDRYNADNRLNSGISKDLVSHALSGFGIKLYGSSTNFDNLFQMFVGEFFTTGSEQINTFISSSEIPIPREEYQKQMYKRLYHNIPLLLKSKGTEKGLRALVNAFGIPEETLSIRVFGGQNVNDRPYFGPFSEYTSSVDKIRIDNTGSIIKGNTLSYHTSIIKPEYLYTQDVHPIEVGFSPAYSINNYIISSSIVTGSFDMDNYIGDPRVRYDHKYRELEKYSNGILSGSITSRFDLYDFVRSVKFFDSTVFKMIKDFTPARSTTATGIIIKSHILERNKIKQVHPKWSIQDKVNTNPSSSLDYSNSLSAYENNFSFYGEIPIGQISAGHGGSFGTGSISGSYDGLTFMKEYDTRFSYFNRLPIGNYDTVKTKDETKLNGEFGEIVSKIDGQIVYKPHNIFVTDGELNRANIFKKTNYKPYYFLIRALKKVDPDQPIDCRLEGFMICCSEIAGCYDIVGTTTPTPTPTATPTVTPTPTITPTPTVTPTPTPFPGVWSAGGAMITGRTSLAAAGTQNETLIFGGLTNTSVSCTEEYDGSSWTTGGTMITGRRCLSSAQNGSQNAALAIAGNAVGNVSTCTEEYDGSSWSTGGALINSRYAAAGFGTQNAGGVAGGNSAAACTEEYNGTSWSSGGALSVARYCLGSGGTQNSAVVFGGKGPGASVCTNTEEYNGSSWTAGGSLNASGYTSGTGASTNSALSIQGGSTMEEYNGTSWFYQAGLNTTRSGLAAAGTVNSAIAAGGSFPLGACTEEYTCI